MPFDAKAIANYFLDLPAAKAEGLTPMKLQKLVYYSHGWHLALKGEPLLDEVIQAWSYGPVVRSLYNALREYGAGPITGKASKVHWSDWAMRVSAPTIADFPNENGEYAKLLLERVWNVYGGFSAIRLSNMTHAPGTPWDRVYQMYHGRGCDIPRYEVIPNDWIKEHFQKPGAI